MIVDTTTWPLRHPIAITFDAHMGNLVNYWERYLDTEDDPGENGADRAIAKMDLEGEFQLTMLQFLKDNPDALLYHEGPLTRIMKKVGAESLDELEKKVDKLIMKNKIIEEAE